MQNENDHAKIKQILLTGIAISVNNIVNSNTTRTADGMEPYKYLYLEIHTDMSFEIKERKKSILLYNPTHPDTILRGEFSGYVDYPDIDVAREQSDIEAMLKLLETLPMGG
ncbi:MAG: hypothetical protein Ta2A_01120 [Treponemataceae bacterium]|nr:MAG: hypothetical protein Ta2A_01120 [Treponemataceae bacterium]